MRIRRAVLLSLCMLTLCAFLGPRANADPWNRKTIVTFADSVQIPGQTLVPGTYVFKLLDSPANRETVQIWTGDESQVLATLIAIPDYRLDAPDHSVFEFDERPADQPMALHSWFYPGNNAGVQFIYW